MSRKVQEVPEVPEAREMRKVQKIIVTGSHFQLCIKDGSTDRCKITSQALVARSNNLINSVV